MKLTGSQIVVECLKEQDVYKRQEEQICFYYQVIPPAAAVSLDNKNIFFPPYG